MLSENRGHGEIFQLILGGQHYPITKPGKDIMKKEN